MAVNVNTVYQTVLYILNKEQRGYVTPAEFNSLAVQVQDEIFHSYFPDGNQSNRLNQNNSQNDTDFFNIFKNISYKLAPFIDEVDFTIDINNSSQFYYPTYNNVTTLLNRTIYNIGDVVSNYLGQTTQNSITQLVSKKEFNEITRSKLTAPNKTYPLFYTRPISSVLPYDGTGPVIFVNPAPNSISVNCLFEPIQPSWGFTSGTLNQYLYSANKSVNFELDNSEQSEIVMRILKYCGVIINDPTIIQAAAQDIQQTSINEKS
jgi:hypothetical protein